jgi:hypothetical protein
MPFPEKYKHLLEITLDQLEKPKKAVLTYAVCAYEDNACGWQGWIIEAIASNEKFLPADTDQRCPVCNGLLYRTDKLLFVLSDNQNIGEGPLVEYK